MRTEDMITSLDQLSDDELMERLRQVRHNREVARPAAARKTAKVEARQSRVKHSTAEKLLAGLSDAERQKLIDQYSQ